MGGFMPLSFQEINAYIQATNIPLNTEEVLLIRKLSEAFCREINNKDPHLKSPHKRNADKV